ncbi:GreA/GreB family elongation factor [Prosthecobacter sp.]|uniref:GreA/GreB family elongation factor n=1 Tax=Prosthecobacter sp. TaxID=1965333 RepID=UPI0037844706
MSRAFVKEDIEEPQRATQRRPATGLPPGALNLMTSDGARILRTRLSTLQRDPAASPDELAALQQSLDTATIIEHTARPDAIVFGSRVTLRRPDGTLEKWRIVGVDEVPLESGFVSWLSPLGKALLAAQPGKPFRLQPTSEIFGTVVETS